MVDLIINKGRAFIYSTAPPPAQAEAAKKALEIIISDEGEDLRKKLWVNIESFVSSLREVRDVSASSAIIPWHVGEANEALELSNRLLNKNIFVPAIRYPTVATETARLRITVTAKHEVRDLKKLADELILCDSL